MNSCTMFCLFFLIFYYCLPFGVFEATVRSQSHLTRSKFCWDFEKETRKWPCFSNGNDSIQIAWALKGLQPDTRPRLSPAFPHLPRCHGYPRHRPEDFQLVEDRVCLGPPPSFQLWTPQLATTEGACAVIERQARPFTARLARFLCKLKDSITS